MPEASAPGKLVIVGEYAVLEGAPAIATAVDVRARARVSRSEGPDSVLIDSVSGEAFAFRSDEKNGLRWLGESPGPRGAIIEAVFAIFMERTPGRIVPALCIGMDTHAFYNVRDGSSVKLGLGSSAAALVALVGALTRIVNESNHQTRMLDFCCAAHRRFQGGQGSGVDVATALLGGAVGIRSAGLESAPEATSLVWPDGLFMLPVWSGRSASTTDLLGRFRDYRSRDPRTFRSHMAQLCDLAEQAQRAWVDRSVATLLESLAAYDAALRAMDRDGEIGINTDVHEVLRGLSEGHGAVYKTSGAGGGDYGIALSDSREVIDTLSAALLDGGYSVLDGSIDVDGLTVVDEVR